LDRGEREVDRLDILFTWLLAGQSKKLLQELRDAMEVSYNVVRQDAECGESLRPDSIPDYHRRLPRIFEELIPRLDEGIQSRGG